MDKQLIQAVAGAGKTTRILSETSADRRSLIVTYTNENFRSLESSIVGMYKRIPEFITLRTYFSFLHSFGIRPYFSYILRDKGFAWGPPPTRAQRSPKSDLQHYMSPGRYLYASRAAKLILESEAFDLLKNRIERHFDNFLVDEVQDFAANDFNLLLGLNGAKVATMFVGDYHQHTYDTSRDGNIRSSLHKKGVNHYLAEFKKVGMDIDTASLDKSHRCSPDVCQFITKTLGIRIESHRADQTDVEFITDKERAQNIFRDPAIVKLFYKQHLDFHCHSNNWGLSKGLNSYGDVCVVLNKKTAKFVKEGKADKLPDGTKNKLYVACSRARGNLYLMEEELLA